MCNLRIGVHIAKCNAKVHARNPCYVVPDMPINAYKQDKRGQTVERAELLSSRFADGLHHEGGHDAEPKRPLTVTLDGAPRAP